MNKKLSLLITMLLMLVLLVGCNEKNEVIIKEEKSLIEDIRFKNNLINLDTDKETIVFYPTDVHFQKTSEPSYLNYKEIENQNKYEQNLVTGDFPREKRYDIYLNEKSFKDISKRYAEEFNETLKYEN